MPEFDLIAPVYDATRRPPSAQELEVTSGLLGEARSLLEVGVGTGRYAVPLRDRGFELTGVDISREMLRRASDKGLPRLLLADLHHLPFRPRSFDAALIVHVLQLIPDPAPALAEMALVARRRVVALNPDRGWGESGPGGRRFRERYRELAAELGYPLPPRQRYWENLERLLTAVPPVENRLVEEEVPYDPDRARRWRDARTFGGLIQVPPEVHEQIVARMLAEAPPQEQGPRPPRLRKVRIVAWDVEGLPEALARAFPPSPSVGPAP